MCKRIKETITIDISIVYSNSDTVVLSMKAPLNENMNMKCKPDDVLSCSSYDDLFTVIRNSTSLNITSQEQSKRVSHRKAFEKEWKKKSSSFGPYNTIDSITFSRVFEAEYNMFLGWSNQCYAELKPLAKKAAGKTAKADEAIPEFEKYIDTMSIRYPDADTPGWPSGFCKSGKGGNLIWHQLTDDVKTFARMITNRTIPAKDYLEEVTIIDYTNHSIKQYANVIPGGPAANQQEKDSITKGLSACDGLTFVITGDLRKYKQRGELVECIENAGGKVGSTVTKNTDYLIMNNKRVASSKNKKAKELGTKVITESEFINMFTQSKEDVAEQRAKRKPAKPSAKLEYIITNGVLEITSPVKSIRADKFRSNEDIRKVIVCEGVERIGNGAFELCSNLEEVILPGTIKTIDERAFNMCNNLKEIIIPESVRTIGIYAYGRELFSPTFLKTDRSMISLQKVVIPDTIIKQYSLKDLKNRFDLSNMISSMLLYPDNYSGELKTKLISVMKKNKDLILRSSISADNAEMLGNYLSFQKKVTLEMIDEMLEIAERNNEPLPVVTAYLLDYKNMHFNRNQIEKAAEDKIEKELGIKERTVSEWRRVFKFSIRDGMAVINRLNTDENVEELVIPDMIGKNKVVGIADEAFCFTSFKEIIIPDSIEFIGVRAFRKSCLREVRIPRCVKEVDKEAFQMCSYLEKVTIEGLKVIDYRTFNQCKSLKEVRLESGTEKIMKDAFSECTSLKRIVIPESVGKIYFRAFDNCTELEEVVLLGDNTVVDEEAFHGCDKVRIIIMY